MKDMFGKCEICFRAGYCSISQCKEQETRELDVINGVINKATLTSKVDENLLKNLPEIQNVTPKDVIKTQKLNIAIKGLVGKELKDAIKNKSTEVVVPHIQSLVKNYFHEPFQATHGTVREILYTAKPIGSAELTYWNQHANAGISKSTDEAQNLLKKFDLQVSSLKDLKAKATKKGQLKQFKKAAFRVKANIESVEKKYKATEDKLNKKENSIKKTIASKVSSASIKVKTALNDSLKKVQQIKGVVHNVKNQLSQRTQQLKN